MKTEPALVSAIAQLESDLPEPKGIYYREAWTSLRERFEQDELGRKDAYNVGWSAVQGTLLVLLSMSDGYGQNAFPSKATIAGKLGIPIPEDRKPKRVQRALRCLESLGVIRQYGKVPHPRNAGRYSSNYELPGFQQFLKVRNVDATPENIYRDSYVAEPLKKTINRRELKSLSTLTRERTVSQQDESITEYFGGRTEETEDGDGVRTSPVSQFDALRAMVQRTDEEQERHDRLERLRRMQV